MLAEIENISSKKHSLTEKVGERLRKIKERITGEDKLRKALEEREEAWKNYLHAIGEQRVLQMLKEGRTPEEISYFTNHLTELQYSIIVFGAKQEVSPKALDFGMSLSNLVRGMLNGIESNIQGQNQPR